MGAGAKNKAPLRFGVETSVQDVEKVEIDDRSSESQEAHRLRRILTLVLLSSEEVDEYNILEHPRGPKKWCSNTPNYGGKKMLPYYGGQPIQTGVQALCCRTRCWTKALWLLKRSLEWSR